MNSWQSMVEAFMRGVGQGVPDDIEEPEVRDAELRAKLIMEEAVETCAAMGFHVTAEINKPECSPRVTIASFEKLHHKPDLIETIDGLCDLIYVITGTAVAAGVDLDPHFHEVHRANMMKLQGPKREDGKQLKPEGWQPPDHERILIRAREQADRWKELESKVFSG